MASPAEKVSLFLLLTLLSSLHTHARDSQFFNKIPSTTNNAVVPTNKEAPINQQEPTFLPQNEDSYGLYGHESGQNPPNAAADTTTTTTPNAEFNQPPNKYLPKNYNPVAYVTQPENVNEGGNSFTEERTFSTNPNPNNNNNDKNNYYNNNNNPQNYYNNNQQQQEATEFRSYNPVAAADNRDNGADNFYYNGGGSSFNSQPQGAANSFQPQGMSDTRYVENGKYFYDLNSEKYSRNHPYQSLRGAVQPQNEYNSRNFYGNNANEFDNRNYYGNNANDEFNGEDSMGGYQEFQNEENMP